MWHSQIFPLPRITNFIIRTTLLKQSRNIPKFLGQLKYLIFYLILVISLEFISSFAEKFRNIFCEIRKFLSKRPEAFLEKWERNKSQGLQWNLNLCSPMWKSRLAPMHWFVLRWVLRFEDDIHSIPEKIMLAYKAEYVIAAEDARIFNWSMFEKWIKDWNFFTIEKSGV